MEVVTSGGRRIRFPRREGRRMILLKVNTVCNLRCDYCWYVINPSLHVPVREEMSTAEMDSMLQEMRVGVGDVVYLAGGEAVLRKDIAAICSRLRSAGATTYLTTNGMLLERLLPLAEQIDGYVVSLDSATSEFHDRHRGGHRRTLEAIPELASHAPVCVTVVLSRENLDELGWVAETSVNMGAKSLFYQLLWLPVGTAARRLRCLGPEDVQRLREALDNLDGYRHNLRLPHSSYRAIVEATVAEGGASGHVVDCFGIDGYLTTDPRGGILRCLPHEFVTAGGESLDVPWRDGVCPFLSEECMCLMGHFHTDLFDEQS